MLHRPLVLVLASAKLRRQGVMVITVCGPQGHRR